MVMLGRTETKGNKAMAVKNYHGRLCHKHNQDWNNRFGHAGPARCGSYYKTSRNTAASAGNLRRGEEDMEVQE